MEGRVRAADETLIKALTLALTITLTPALTLNVTLTIAQTVTLALAVAVALSLTLSLTLTLTLALTFTADNRGLTLMSETHTPHHDASKICILRPVWRSGKLCDCGVFWTRLPLTLPVWRSGKPADWLYRGKSCQDLSLALGTRF